MRKLLVILLLGIFSCNESTREKEKPSKQKKKAIDQVKLNDLKGRQIDLDQFSGKTVFINFWATWCKPCIMEMPSVDRAQKLLNGSGVVFLLASPETADEITMFEKNSNYNFSYVQVGNLEELNIGVLPTTYIFNSNGELAFAETGSRKWDDPKSIEIISKIKDQK